MSQRVMATKAILLPLRIFYSGVLLAGENATETTIEDISKGKTVTINTPHDRVISGLAHALYISWLTAFAVKKGRDKGRSETPSSASAATTTALATQKGDALVKVGKLPMRRERKAGMLESAS